MNILDNVIAFFDPKAGLERARYRMAVDASRNYDAASKSRRTSSWKATSTSANAETYKAVVTLRDRSREQVRNNPYAKKAIGTIARNTVGSGIRPRILKDGKTDKVLMEAFNDWADDVNCDFDGVKNFYGLQRLIMTSVAESGSVLIRKRMVEDKENPVRLQVLESDFLDINRQNPSKSGHYIINGIEFDTNGQRFGYWLFNQHPGENTLSFGRSAMKTTESKMVPVDEIAHAYVVDRPGQVDGTPHGASSMLRLRDFEEYEDAQLMRQKIAACFAAFVESPDVSGVGGSTTTENEPLTDKVQPGIIQELMPGQKMTFTSPPGTDGYKDYSRQNLQGVSAGFGPTYESVTGDLSNVNFSSGRMGWIEAQRLYNDLQTDVMIVQVCNKVIKWFFQGQSLASGKIKGKVKTEWTPPRREMIDPVKETEAIIAQIRGGLISWQEAVREQGWDPEVLMKHFVEDFKNFDANKIILDSDPRQAKAPASAQPGDQKQGQKEDGKKVAK
jgi:lambda family phage portal protein